MTEKKQIRIRLENKAGVKITGTVYGRMWKGGSQLVGVNIDGTTTSCYFDLADFDFVHEAQA